MKNISLKKTFICAILVSVFANISLAQTSNEYAVMALATWSSFTCSVLASKSGNQKEQNRLFIYGYEQGKTFINAVMEKRIEKKDLDSEVPVIVGLLLQGPSPDFMLGRIYENAIEDALEDIYGTVENRNTDDERKHLAKNKYRKLNCSIIGI